jgi:4-hydroxy-2-oxoheptanedioate aldolase
VAQIEDRQGVENIEEILACDPGIDALIVGRSDLASSLNVPGQVEDPAVIAATHRVITAARNAPRRVSAGIGIYGPQEASKWIEAGCQLFFYSADTAMLLNATTAAADAFRAAAGAPAIKSAAE